MGLRNFFRHSIAFLAVLLIFAGLLNVSATAALADESLPDLNDELFRSADVGLPFSNLQLLPWKDGTRNVALYGTRGDRTTKLWINIYSFEPSVAAKEYAIQENFLFGGALAEGERLVIDDSTEVSSKRYTGYIDDAVPISAHYLLKLSEQSYALVQLEFWPAGSDSPDDAALDIFEKAIDFVNSLVYETEYLEGTVTGVDKLPLPNCRVLFYEESEADDDLLFVAETVTDDAGYFKIPYDATLEEGRQGALYINMEYVENGQIMYRIMYLAKPVGINKYFLLEEEKDLTQNVSLLDASQKDSSYTGAFDLSGLAHFEAMYRHMMEAWRFYTTHTDWNLNYKLPVDVISFSGSKTYYSPKYGKINISAWDSVFDSPQAPMNREWHEFSHHAMFSQYGMWPELLPGSENHAGYINPSTADSLLEGFAEFMACVIADTYGYPNPNLYQPYYNLELNYKGWEYRGKAEEIAFAGLLWDLYDPANDDAVDLSLGDILLLLNDYLPDVATFYERAIAQFPSKADAIREVFVMHGFFADREAGNNTYDTYEPFTDKNKNATYDSGEYFIDYAQRSPVYNQSDAVGQATNYQRSERRNTVTFPGFFISTPSEAAFFVFRFEFEEQASLNYELVQSAIDGKIPFPVPAENIAYTVTVEAVDGQTGNPLVLHSTELVPMLDTANERGDILEHDFQVTGASVRTKVLPESSSDALDTPYWEQFNLRASTDDYTYQYQPETPQTLSAQADQQQNDTGMANRGIMIVIIIAVILAVGVGGFFLIRMRKK
ncbi:hypothetical protein [Phosphitispora sp. TUW77]|uniref:hypothetical protein n=1 Tax=Phosphitispora sp. TUW77 TaxID=3152361 RepID=UPI003AB652B5